MTTKRQGNAPLLHGVWIGNTLCRPCATEAIARSFADDFGAAAEYAPITWVADKAYAAGVRPVKGQA